jgi:hypothetical protein
LRAGQVALCGRVDDTVRLLREVADNVARLNDVDAKLRSVGLDPANAGDHQSDLRLLRRLRTGRDWLLRRAWTLAGVALLAWAASTFAPTLWRYAVTGVG